jgi:hypothetical protein
MVFFSHWFLKFKSVMTSSVSKYKLLTKQKTESDFYWVVRTSKTPTLSTYPTSTFTLIIDDCTCGVSKHFALPYDMRTVGLAN